jgi:ABC-type dipeptide/oligopeptide/nickel transport system permease component
VYDGQAPGYIWHIDKHHKIGQWGFVIFGAICGYTHQIIALKCSINNKALTLLNALNTSPGMLERGLPDLIRGDAGMENVAIARLLNYINGERHFLIGRSVHNQRIERLWRDLFLTLSAFIMMFLLPCTRQ